MRTVRDFLNFLDQRLIENAGGKREDLLREFLLQSDQHMAFQRKVLALASDLLSQVCEDGELAKEVTDVYAATKIPDTTWSAFEQELGELLAA